MPDAGLSKPLSNRSILEVINQNGHPMTHKREFNHHAVPLLCMLTQKYYRIQWYFLPNMYT